jgi:hypothetical protein
LFEVPVLPLKINKIKILDWLKCHHVITLKGGEGSPFCNKTLFSAMASLPVAPGGNNLAHVLLILVYEYYKLVSIYNWNWNFLIMGAVHIGRRRKLSYNTKWLGDIQ